MARAALRDQAANAQFVARTLGASRAEATRRVVLPMLRPAIAAGAAVVAMETLTDFATVQYFDVETVTVGMFRIWRGTYDRDAASEIASLVLMFALLAIAFERLLRGRARFGESGGQSAGVEPHGGSRGFKGAWRRRPPAGRGHDRLRGAGAAAGHVGDRRAAQPARHADGRRLRRVPRQQPRAGRSPRRWSAWSSLRSITNARRFGNPRLVGAGQPAQRRRLRRARTGGGDGGRVALVALDDRLERIGLGLPGAVATGSFIALVYAYVDPLPRPGDRHRPRPGSGRCPTR